MSQSFFPKQYLQTSQLPILNVIAVRRILYLHNILRRHDEELIKRVCVAMKDLPVIRDWSNIVKEDMIKISLNLSNEDISMLPKYKFKVMVKKHVRKHVFSELETIKQGHSKVKDIVHTHKKYPLAYLTSSLYTNPPKSLLFNL